MGRDPIGGRCFWHLGRGKPCPYGLFWVGGIRWGERCFWHLGRGKPCPYGLFWVGGIRWGGRCFWHLGRGKPCPYGLLWGEMLLASRQGQALPLRIILDGEGSDGGEMLLASRQGQALPLRIILGGRDAKRYSITRHCPRVRCLEGDPRSGQCGSTERTASLEGTDPGRRPGARPLNHSAESFFLAASAFFAAVIQVEAV